MLLPRWLLLYIVQNKFILVFIATLYLYHPYNLTSWNTRRCSGFKIKWKNPSDMFVAGFWIVATQNVVGID
jgi:hypothetical protein